MVYVKQAVHFFGRQKQIGCHPGSTANNFNREGNNWAACKKGIFGGIGDSSNIQGELRKFSPPLLVYVHAQKAKRDGEVKLCFEKWI